MPRSHRISIHWLVEAFRREGVKIRFVSAKAQIADILTKHFAKPELWHPLLRRAGIRLPSRPTTRESPQGSRPPTRSRSSSPALHKHYAMAARLKPSSKEQLATDASVAHAAREDTAVTMQGNIGGEGEYGAARAVNQGARARRRSLWWSFAFSDAPVPVRGLPEAVGGRHHSPEPTEATFRHWWRLMHGEGCRPLIAKKALQEIGNFEDYLKVAVDWSKLNDPEAVQTYWEVLQFPTCDPRGFRVVQEMPAPPAAWEDTSWHGQRLNIVGDSVYWVGHNAGTSFNLLSRGPSD